MLDLVDVFERHAGSATIRFGADMLALSVPAQKVLDGIRDIRPTVRGDGKVHKGFVSFAGTLRHPSLL
jgi:hypothetical protein